MTPRRTMRITPPTTNPTPLADRGRMLFVPDVRELLKGKKSIWWVRNKFAPELRHKLGRDTYWWENEITGWLDSQDAA